MSLTRKEQTNLQAKLILTTTEEINYYNYLVYLLLLLLLMFIFHSPVYYPIINFYL